jgi:hypothetical protein
LRQSKVFIHHFFWGSKLMFKLTGKSGSALLLAFGMSSTAIAPFTLPLSAIAAPVAAPLTVAQLFPTSPTTIRRVAIPAGTRLPVQYTKADKVVVLPTETVDLNLIVSRNIRSSSGALLIPAGSEVRGRLQPAEGGSQFVANQIVLTDGTRLAVDAQSQVIATNQEVKRGTNTGSILTGAAIGAGAAAAISGLTGNRRITLGKVLIGAGAGALGGLLVGNRNKVDVVTINPNTDLNLTLNSSLTVAAR